MRLPVLERFWNYVEETDGCWFWRPSKLAGEYGSFAIGRNKKIWAHIFSYVIYHHQEVPEGMELDHTCRNHCCVNPMHLEPVTHRVNILRGESPFAKNARKQVCKRGHDLSLAYRRSSRNSRECRECKRIRTNKCA